MTLILVVRFGFFIPFFSHFCGLAISFNFYVLDGLMGKGWSIGT